MKMLKKWKENRKKTKAIKEALKKSEATLWWCYWETEENSGSIRVYADSEEQAKYIARKLLSEQLSFPFEITGTAAI